MVINRETALKILGLQPNAGEGDIKKAYYTLALKHHPDKNLGSGQKAAEEKFKQLNDAYKCLIGESVERTTELSEENLNVIDSVEALKFFLYTALLKQDTAFLTKLFSRFKSSEDEKFGDYINEMRFEGHSPLSIALSKARDLGNLDPLEILLTNGANPNMKVYYCDKYYYETSLHYIGILEDSRVVKLLLEYGADPNIPNERGDVVLCKACYNGYTETVDLLLKYGAGVKSEYINEALLSTLQSKECEKKEIVEQLLKYGADPNCEIQDRRLIEHVPHSSNNEVKKLFVQYGGVDRRYLRDQTASACCCLVIASATLYYIESSWRYASVACALVACFFVNNAIQAAFFAKTTEPSPELVKIKKVNPLKFDQLQQ